MSALGSEDLFPSEVVLSQSLGVSRTTVRKVLSELESQGLVVTSNRQRRLVRRPIAKPFPETETLSTSAHIERQFMEWTLRDNLGSGASFNELELARRFGVATSAIREFLNRFQHYGLIEKAPERGLAVQGIHPRIRTGAIRNPRNVRVAFGLGFRRSATAVAAVAADRVAGKRSIRISLPTLPRNSTISPISTTGFTGLSIQLRQTGSSMTFTTSSA
ncbi:GntR family transcriptional regulator [Roseibium salinum]|nr:GntR family transcriptional regulator [Roseibium salinum]